MNSAQGLVPRKILGEMGKAVTAVAMASSPSSASFSSSDHLPPAVAVSGGALPSSPYSSSNTSFVKSPNMNIILALFAAFFLTTLLSVYLQHCYLRRNLGAAAILPYYLRPPSPPHSLDSSILQTLPKVIFSSSATAIAQQKTQTECAICLEEFKDGQTLQVLPQCRHCFHPECIHMWLFSHVNCPLCRHSLLIPLKPSPTSSSSSSTSAPTQPPPLAPLQAQSSAVPSPLSLPPP